MLGRRRGNGSILRFRAAKNLLPDAKVPIAGITARTASWEDGARRHKAARFRPGHPAVALSRISNLMT